MPSQLTTWRRLAKEGKLGFSAIEVDEPIFALLVIRQEATAAIDATIPLAETRIRIVRGLVVIKLAHCAPVARNAEIFHALEAHRY